MNFVTANTNDLNKSKPHFSAPENAIERLGKICEIIETTQVIDKNFIGSIEQAIGASGLVSFDLFDTLVRRPFLHPTHLFDYIGYSKGDFKFGRARRDAEISARVLAYPERDVRIDQIYDRLVSGVQMQEEKKLEVQVLYRRPWISELLLLLRELGHKIAIVTDMYLDETTIRSVLEKFGISADFILISSVEGTTKGDGSSFRLLFEKARLDPRSVVHIGDNGHSDFKVPSSLGCKTILLSERVAPDAKKYDLDHEGLLNALANNGSLASSIYGAGIRDALNQIESSYTSTFWEYFGASYIGPICYGFCRWIGRTAREKNKRRVVFVSRDGFLPRQLFEKTDPSLCGPYLYISRSVLVKADLDIQCDATIKQLVGGLEAPLSVFLERIGLEGTETYKRAMARFGGNVIIRGKLRSRLASFLSSERHALRMIAEKNRRILEKYFCDHDLLTSPQDICLVDIGWSGSSAEILGSIFPECKHWHYLYFGSRPEARSISNSNSYWFEFGVPSENFHLAFSCIEIIELLFTSPEGSVLDLTLKGDDIVPELHKSELEVIRTAAVKEMHAGADCFFQQMLRFESHLKISVSDDNSHVTTILHHLLGSHSLELGNQLERIPHSVGFGESAAEYLVPSARPKFWHTVSRIARGRGIKVPGAHVFWKQYVEARFYRENQKPLQRWAIRHAHKIRRRGGIKLFGVKFPITRR